MNITEQYKIISKEGKQAEARIHGTLRGGYVLNDKFYAHCMKTIDSDDLNNVENLRYTPYN